MSRDSSQKLPKNINEILEEAYLCEAYCIHNYNIHEKLLYVQGANMTWHPKGDKQVPAAGRDNKWVFTLVSLISASGELLPFQAIFQGSTEYSCPSKDAPGYNKAKKLGFRLEPSKSDMYWSTFETMKLLVNDIIAPYFESKKVELGIKDPDSQYSIWKIDCWLVHKLKAFLEWMKVTHPNIIVIFIPGNCTAFSNLLMLGSNVS
ncbi:hypothetical protein BT96DRAFT_960005 [Gymnopus androsaceus JB14]|uniref:DDE-1 domain-containing protein n=1 Tax=Gymnopus androsaceus JB14 TaxID=1447944 RepID=A0A6A4GWX8_9AGAR|nr:hypothetical protein BT96DRAFT_960005 [Gymnopus androsaceus JB14]